MIDYEKLADAVDDAYLEKADDWMKNSVADYIARAVVAALGEQGLVVVNADDLARLCELAQGFGYRQGDHDLIVRCAALAAPDDGSTP